MLTIVETYVYNIRSNTNNNFQNIFCQKRDNISIKSLRRNCYLHNNITRFSLRIAHNKLHLIFSHSLITDCSSIPHKNIETNDKFYRKVAFLMYTEMVNFRPQS